MKNTYYILCLFFWACLSQEKENTPKGNELIHETSPYLLQHAKNPVHWKAWNDKSLKKAKDENKLIIISIGYSACHWCHVMEEESFKDNEVASVMNSSFINIKVDREERPDVDQIYMKAIQLLNGTGGWPLNIVALPDGRPIWGGTYFRKNEWINALTELQKKFQKEPDLFYKFANNLEKGIKNSDLITTNKNQIDFKKEQLSKIVTHWEKQLDQKHGGTKRAPKFMLPNNYNFLLKFGYLYKNKELLEHVNLTLKQMAFGGVFDPIEGGFSRYSTDIRWHIPHFEKMLYDNAQLVSLYSNAYKLTKKELYRETIIKTLDFIENDLYHKDGYFYSSLDADSYNKLGDKEEGAYYVWKKEELRTILKDNYALFSDYYNINEYGYWEYKNYILTRKNSNEKISKKHNITEQELKTKINACLTRLKIHKGKRKKPALDDKSLTSWNALAMIGFLDAFEALGDNHYLNIALKNANFITKHQLKDDGSLYHNFKNDISSINAYLEDYAISIKAFIKLYENTLDSQWLFLAKRLTDYCYKHFYNKDNNLFYFNSNKDKQLITRPIEYQDNVIPASNSIMAKNLFVLSKHFNNNNYLNTSKKMLHNIAPHIDKYGSSYSNWLDLYLNFIIEHKETVITGENALANVYQLKKNYLPNTIFSGYSSSIKNNSSSENLPLIKNRVSKKDTYFYICKNGSCYLPTKEYNKALYLIKN